MAALLSDLAIEGGTLLRIRSESVEKRQSGSNLTLDLVRFGATGVRVIRDIIFFFLNEEAFAIPFQATLAVVSCYPAIARTPCARSPVISIAFVA